MSVHVAAHPSVLHVLAPGAAGGLESVVRTLAAGQAERGLRVAVACVLDAGTEPPPFIDALDAAGVAVIQIPVPPRGYLREFASLRRVISVARPDLVHTHGYRADVLGSRAARRLGVATVSTAHGFTGGGRKNRLYEWLQVRSFRRMDAVIAVSRPLLQRLREAGVPESRLHGIPNAWSASEPPLSEAESRARLGLPPEATVLGWVGRLSREKGADVFLRAFAQLQPLAGSAGGPASGPIASVLGEGRERPALEALAGELGVADRVRWHGVVPDAARLFAAFDTFVLSSRTEGTPIALFEAMAGEVPVVATAVGGVPDVVTPTEAVLVPSDDPAALAAAIGALLEDRDGAATRARAARVRLDSAFGVAPWLELHEALYRSVVARSPSPWKTS